MSNEEKSLSAYCYQQHDRFYFGENEKQYQVVVRASNGKYVSVLFDEKQEIEDMPPSEVIQLIKERVKSFWIMPDREKRMEVIEWFEQNAEKIDSGWALRSIEGLRKKIDDLQRYVITE
jgi:hypothetical protein